MLKIFCPMAFSYSLCDLYTSHVHCARIICYSWSQILQKPTHLLQHVDKLRHSCLAGSPNFQCKLYFSQYIMVLDNILLRECSHCHYFLGNDDGSDGSTLDLKSRTIFYCSRNSSVTDFEIFNEGVTTLPALGFQQQHKIQFVLFLAQTTMTINFGHTLSCHVSENAAVFSNKRRYRQLLLSKRFIDTAQTSYSEIKHI